PWDPPPRAHQAGRAPGGRRRRRIPDPGRGRWGGAVAGHPGALHRPAGRPAGPGAARSSWGAGSQADHGLEAAAADGPDRTPHGRDGPGPTAELNAGDRRPVASSISCSRPDRIAAANAWYSRSFWSAYRSAKLVSDRSNRSSSPRHSAIATGPAGYRGCAPWPPSSRPAWLPWPPCWTVRPRPRRRGFRSSTTSSGWRSVEGER